MTAVKEPVDRFPGDGPVRVALLPAMAGNWRSTRSWTLNLYPPAWRDAARSATRPSSVASGTALTRPRLAEDILDVQRAAS